MPPGGQNAALQGASLAFTRSGLNPTGAFEDGASGVKAALTAATRADRNSQQYRAPTALPARILSPPEHDSNRGGSGTTTVPLAAAIRSVSQDRASQASQASNRTSAHLDQEQVPSRAPSTSSIAASRAAARFTSSASTKGLVEQDSVSRASLASMASRKGSRTRSSSSVSKRDAAVDSASVPPTAALIGMFESGAVASAKSTKGSPERPTPAPTRSPSIISPQPVRPTAALNVPLAAALVAAQKSPSPPKPKPAPSRSVRRSPAENGAQGAIEAGTVGAVTDRPTLPPRSETKPAVPKPRRAPPPPFHPEEKDSIPSPIAPNPIKTRQRSISLEKDTLARPTRPTSMGSIDAVDRLPPATARPEPEAMSPGQDGSPWRQPSLNDLQKIHHSRQPRLHPHMTGDSLADAIVASSLASSRVPSPSISPAPPPAVPPPRRHSRAHLLFPPRNTGPEAISRTPSPAKGMRQTMRQAPKTSDEESSPARIHRGKKNLIKKHPNKHHEGDRKRWRDQITERERKRYEGVWAANKGVLVTQAVAPVGSRKQASGISAEEANELVSNIVTREIWQRSRLPDDVLEEIWALVDGRGIGALDRAEFVVGLWLIDQRLKGRKLPIKVSASVWDSVRWIGGVLVRERR